MATMLWVQQCWDHGGVRHELLRVFMLRDHMHQSSQNLPRRCHQVITDHLAEMLFSFDLISCRTLVHFGGNMGGNGANMR